MSLFDTPMIIKNYQSTFDNETGDKVISNAEIIHAKGIITANPSIRSYLDDGIVKQGIQYNILTNYPAYSVQERRIASLILARNEYYKVVAVVHMGSRGHYRSIAIKTNKDRLRQDKYNDI